MSTIDYTVLATLRFLVAVSTVDWEALLGSCSNPWARFTATPPTLASSMPRLRHRMRSCRGGTRGRPPSVSPSHSSNAPSRSSGLIAGNYPRTRSGRGHFIPSTSVPPPTTGSARFTFDSALNRPKNYVLFSVIFQEEVQPGESNAHPTSLAQNTAHGSNL